MKLYSIQKWGTRRKNQTMVLSEWETDEFFFKKEMSKIRRGWTVVDVGSEFGYYAIKAGKLVGNSGKVLAVEAHPETYRILKMNIKLHGLSNVIPVCRAVGSGTQMVRLHETADPGGTTIVSPRPLYNLTRKRLLRFLGFLKDGNVFEIMRRRVLSREFVLMGTLDRIVNDNAIEHVNLVKIDVEGAELAVLKGSQKILKNYKPSLLIEVHYGYGWNPIDLYKFLEDFGYSMTIEKRNEKSLVSANFLG